MQTTRCSCGSGRSFERCHGDPRNEFARRQALVEARQIALLFPSVRPRAPQALALAARLAEDLGENDELDDDALTVATAAIEEGNDGVSSTNGRPRIRTAGRACATRRPMSQRRSTSS